MAPYFRDPNEDQNQDQSSVQLGSGGTQVGPDGAPAQGGAPKTAQSASNFTNLDTYLNNNDAKGFGQQFGQKIDSGIDKAKGTVDSTRDQVNNQIKNSYQSPSVDQINSVVQNAGDKTTAEDAKNYQAWTSQSYQGPKSLEDNQAAWGQYWGGVNNANTEAKASGSEGGRFALLDQYFGRPAYNFGEKSLDNLLVQGGGGFTNARELQDKAAGLKDYASEQAKTVQATAAQKAAEVEASKKAARAAIGLQDNGTIKGGAIGQFQDDINARVAQQAALRDAGYTSIKNDLGNDDVISDDTASATGLQNGQHLYNLKLDDDKYFDPGMDPTRENVANDSDYSRYLALSQLAGVNPSFLTESTRGNAGTFSPKATFKKDALAEDLKQAQYAYERDRNESVVIPEFGPVSMSINAMEDYVNKIKKNLRTYDGEDPNRPETWTTREGQWAAKYADYIKKWEAVQKSYRTVNNSGGGLLTRDLSPQVSLR